MSITADKKNLNGRFVDISSKKILRYIKKILSLYPQINMVVVAQLVRASDCGSEGRRFEPDHPPFIFFGFLLIKSFQLLYLPSDKGLLLWKK